MTLASDIRLAVAEVFASALDDIPVNVEFEFTIVGEYDVATDTTAKTITTQTIKCLRTNDKLGEFDFKPNMKTIRLVCPAAPFTRFPEINDTLRIAGEQYEIVDRKEIPSASLYIFQIRAS